MIVPEKYTRTAMVLHWLMALLILANILLIHAVDYVPEDRIRWVIDTHKSTGITLLGLVLMRLLWRALHPPPSLPAGTARWEAGLSRLTHALLYFLMLALPISGWLHDSAWARAPEFPMHLYGTFEWPRIAWISEIEPVAKKSLHMLFNAVHEQFGYVLYALFGLHLAGALKHQFIDRHPALQRMWP